MVVKVEVTGTKTGKKESRETYVIQLPLDAKGIDAASFVNDLLALCLGTTKYERVVHFMVSGMYEQGTLQVQRALTRVSTSMGGGYQEVEPKTEKSRRSIALPDFAIVALVKHRERQEMIKQNAGEYWQEHDYVFCTTIGEHIHPGHHILEEFKKLLKKQVYRISVFMICGIARRLYC